MRDSPIAYTIRTPENFYILIAVCIQTNRIFVKCIEEFLLRISDAVINIGLML